MVGTSSTNQPLKLEWVPNDPRLKSWDVLDTFKGNV